MVHTCVRRSLVMVRARFGGFRMHFVSEGPHKDRSPYVCVCVCESLSNPVSLLAAAAAKHSGSRRRRER